MSSQKWIFFSLEVGNVYSSGYAEYIEKFSSSPMKESINDAKEGPKERINDVKEGSKDSVAQEQ